MFSNSSHLKGFVRETWSLYLLYSVIISTSDKIQSSLVILLFLQLLSEKYFDHRFAQFSIIFKELKGIKFDFSKEALELKVAIFSRFLESKWMYELPQELPNDLRLGRKFKKIPEILGFDGDYPAVHSKAKFWCFFDKKLQTISYKTFHRKTYFS